MDPMSTRRGRRICNAGMTESCVSSLLDVSQLSNRSWCNGTSRKASRTSSLFSPTLLISVQAGLALIPVRVTASELYLRVSSST